MASYSSPAQGTITSRYMQGRVHTGVDIANRASPPIAAWAAGTIAKAGWQPVAGRTGNGIVIHHDDGTASYYGHLASVGVTVGQRVLAGQSIGVMGTTGNSTGIHLHFEIWTNTSSGSHINPEPYAAARGVRIGDPITPPTPDPLDMEDDMILVQSPSRGFWAICGNKAVGIGDMATVNAYNAAGVPIAAITENDMKGLLQHLSARELIWNEATGYAVGVPGTRYMALGDNDEVNHQRSLNAVERRVSEETFRNLTGN